MRLRVVGQRVEPGLHAARGAQLADERPLGGGEGISRRRRRARREDGAKRHGPRRHGRACHGVEAAGASAVRRSESRSAAVSSLPEWRRTTRPPGSITGGPHVVRNRGVRFPDHVHAERGREWIHDGGGRRREHPSLARVQARGVLGEHGRRVDRRVEAHRHQAHAISQAGVGADGGVHLGDTAVEERAVVGQRAPRVDEGHDHGVAAKGAEGHRGAVVINERGVRYGIARGQVTDCRRCRRGGGRTREGRRARAHDTLQVGPLGVDHQGGRDQVPWAPVAEARPVSDPERHRHPVHVTGDRAVLQDDLTGVQLDREELAGNRIARGRWRRGLARGKPSGSREQPDPTHGGTGPRPIRPFLHCKALTRGLLYFAPLSRP